MRPSRRASAQQQSGSDEPKPASAKGSNKENAPSGSKSSSKKENNSKPNSKPTSEKAADANKTTNDPKANSNKPQAGAQNSSGPVFTAEGDAKLLLLKSEGKSWQDIAAAISKTKKQTTKRFGEIKPNDWKPQKGGKHGIDKAGVSDEKNEKNDKHVAKMGKQEVEERKSKSDGVDKQKHKQEQALSAALLVAGKVEHAHAHRHEVHVNHHHHDTQDSRPLRPAKDFQRPRDTKISSKHHNSTNPKSRRLPPPSIAPSSRTAYTLATTPSLTEDDLFSFGELQALSELIGKDMQGMWQRVSAAFFGMTGRRIAAEDIRDKFEGLSE